MPTFTGSLVDVVGDATNGRIDIRASQPRKIAGVIVGTGNAKLNVVNGVIESRTVKPGPVDIYIAVGTWNQKIDNVVIPDTSTADFWDVIESSISYEPAVVSSVRADRLAAEAAKVAAQAAAASVPSDVGAQLAARPTKTVADASYATFPGARAVVIGDSVDVSQEAPTSKSRNSSWFNYACIMSGQRFEYAYNAGITGDTTTLMLARFDTDVTPHAPRLVVIGGGENDADPARSITLTQFATNINALVAKARGIGAAVILRTALPYTGTGGTATTRRANIAAINTWLKSNASRLGAIAVLDMFALMVDPVTGQFLAVYDSGDGIHPNDLGNAVMGAYAADLLTPLLPASPALLAASNVDPANLLTNGLFLGALGGSPANQPPGWYVDNATQAAVSLAPGIAGNNLVLDFATASTAELTVLQQIPATALRTHQAIYSLRLTSALTAGKLGSFEVSSDGTVPLFVRNTYNMAGQIPDGVAKVRFAVPSDATVLNVAHRVPAGAVGRVTLGQATLNDLTALGAI